MFEILLNNFNLPNYDRTLLLLGKKFVFYQILQINIHRHHVIIHHVLKPQQHHVVRRITHIPAK